LFSKKFSTVTRDYDPTITAIIAMICLLLLDVAARKFNFKWPHELLGKKNKTDE